MGKPLFIGVDLGTQSLRAGIFDSAGTALAIASYPLETTFPRPTWAEQQPQAWWNGMCQAVRAAVALARVDVSHIVALAVDAMSSTVVVVDAQGQPLRPAIMWMDTRAYVQAARITATGADVLRFAGRTVSPEFGLPKALWVREYEPDIYARSAVICDGLDWLAYRLTGEWVPSRNTATWKWHYIPQAGGWPNALLRQLDAADLGERWPGGGTAPTYPGTAIGTLSPTAAAELGLPATTIVAQGAVDAYAAAIGMNTLHSGQLGMILGTSTCHMAISDQAIYGTGSWGPYPEPLMPGMWILEGGQTATGSVVRWVEQTAGGGRSLRDLDVAAAKVGPGADGLVALDYWQGNRAPRQDPLARGVFIGLTLSHGADHLLRAVYEATTFGTRHIVEDMTVHGFEPRELVVTGGGTQSRLWLQLHADICGLPVVLNAQPEASVLGAAICAAVGAGAFTDLKDAARAMVHQESRIEPNPTTREIYDRLYGHYLATYDALNPIMHALARGIKDGSDHRAQ